MKLLATLTTALITANISHACPNLSGKYTCVDNVRGNYNVEITQTEDNDVTTYHSNYGVNDTQTMIADGTQRPHTTMENGKEITDGKETITCIDKKVHINLTFTEPSDEMDQVEATIFKTGEAIKSIIVSKLNGQTVESTTTYCVPKTNPTNP